jgi:hypothetical protein
MKILDKIALNRLIVIIADFILKLIKIVSPKSVEDVEIDIKPDKRKIFPIFRRKKKDENIQ